MKSPQLRWLIVGLAGAIFCMGIIVTIGYFAFVMLSGNTLAETAEEEYSAESVQKINGPQYHRDRAEVYFSKLDEADITKRYEIINPYADLYYSLYDSNDFAAVEKSLHTQLEAVDDPWKAGTYSTQIDVLTNIGYGADPEKLLAIADRWTNVNPNSHYAWLVRGGLQRAYAWYWRGSGFSDTVTEEGWKKFYAALEAAKQSLEKSYALNPDDPEVSYQMLWICIGLDASHEEFDRHFNRVTAIVPTHINAHLAKQQYLLPKWHGSWPETDEFIEAALARSDEYKFPALAVVALAGYEEMLHAREGYKDIFERRGYANQLVTRFSKLLELAPDKEIARADYARVLYRVDRYDEALAEFERLGDRFYAGSIWDSVLLYSQCRAFTYFQRGMKNPFTNGKKDLQRAAELGVAYSAAYYYIGLDHFTNQDFDTAAEYFEKAIRVEPEYSAAWVTLSQLYQMQQRTDDLRELALASKEQNFDEATRKHFAKMLKSTR